MFYLLKQVLKTGIKTEAYPLPDEALRVTIGRLQAAVLERFHGSLAIRHVDAGSCNGCELEINQLNCPYYNLEGLGIKFVASPRHADMLLVTGPVSRNMEVALKRTYDATPAPKLVELSAGQVQWIRKPSPGYPAMSKKLNESGTVIIAAYFSSNGSAKRAEIAKSSGFERLDRAAADAVLRSQITPIVSGNSETVFLFNAPISFTLSE